MKVKVGDKIYDGADEPVMIILTAVDKQNIVNMLPDDAKYCVYPAEDKWTKNDYKAILEWMDTEYNDVPASVIDLVDRAVW